MSITAIARQTIRKRAFFLCEYCHSPEKISASRFTIDHIQPRSLGGSDDLDNLALACSRCNQRRYNFIVGRDLKTDSILPLFNPRQQQWSDHFIWALNGTKILGATSSDEQPAIGLISTTSAIRAIARFKKPVNCG